MRPTRLACLAMLAAPAFAQPAPPPDEWFIRTMQAREDAVAPGDIKVWRDTLAPDGLFVDEEDNVFNTEQLLASMHPLPKGYSGHIEVANPKLIRSGDAVVVTADLMETEFVFGQELHTRFRETDVWRPYADGWRIFASHTSVLPSEAKAYGKPAPLRDFTGTYQMAEGQAQTLSVKDGKLWMKRGDAEPEALIPLGGDHFARKGRNRGERIFVRDAKGKVTGFWDRRDNNDLKWAKVG